MTPLSIDPYRWGYIFGLLSLDMVHPFASNMGLQLPDGMEFMTGLRRSIEEVDTVQDPALAPAVFRWLTLEYGSVFVDHLSSWGDTVFQYDADDDGVYLWGHILYGARRLKDTEMPEFISIVSQILAKDSDRKVGESGAVSAWDKFLYAREEYDETTIEFVQSTINHYSLVNAWREAMHAFSGEIDWNEIHRWGIHVSERLRDGFGRPGVPKAWALPLPWR